MTKALPAMCIAAMVGLGAAAYAQSSTMAKDPMDKRSMMKDGQVTVSGCVTAGKDANQHLLTNAMMVGGMMDKKDKEMDKNQMKHPGMMGDQMSFELVGGDVKAHMGHKVEVMGTLSKSDMDRMAKTGTMDKTEKDKMMDKHMSPMKLTVTSVKMVSATCPS